MNKYYVYAHKNNEYGVFYVGKGSNQRLYKTCNRSLFWKRITAKYGYEALILEECESEEIAFNMEIKWIKHFKDLGQCVANFTIGGDGVRVEKRWWNEAISNSLKGKHRRAGKESFSYKDFADEDLLKKLYVIEGKSSVEIAEMLNVSYGTVLTRLTTYGIQKRDSGIKRKKIKCINDGIVYQSISDAAKKYGVFRENIRKVLSGKYKHTGNLKFIYEE
jgi:hypothetical protein